MAVELLAAETPGCSGGTLGCDGDKAPLFAGNEPEVPLELGELRFLYPEVFRTGALAVV